MATIEQTEQTAKPHRSNARKQTDFVRVDQKAKWFLELYGRAEGCLLEAQGKRLPQTASDIQRLFHEVEVHQIELELQNAELLRTREAMEEALGMYSELFDFAPVANFTLNPDGIIHFVGLTGAALLGRERSQLVGRSFLPFVAPKNLLSFTCFLGELVAGRESKTLELVLLPAASPPFFAHIEAVASSMEQKCNIVIFDITKHRQTEEELKMHRMRLESQVREKTLALEGEIAERERLSQEIIELKACLEQRVSVKTSELESMVRASKAQGQGHDSSSPKSMKKGFGERANDTLIQLRP